MSDTGLPTSAECVTDFVVSRRYKSYVHLGHTVVWV